MNKTLIYTSIFGVAIAVVGASNVVVSNIAPDVKITEIELNKQHGVLKSLSTKVIRRGKSQIAIVTKSLTDTGLTNITSSFLVDGIIIATVIRTDSGQFPEKMFIQNPISKNVEGFEESFSGAIIPLAESEIQKFKSDVDKFR